MRKIKLAIIGATGTALKRTLPALKNSEICEVAAIQGRNIDKLREIQHEYGIPEIYTDEKMMLQNAACDCVYIATPPFLHKENIATAVKARKPIICEKPLAANYREGEQIAAMLGSYTEKEFMIAHHLRHQKAIEEIKNTIESGKIGTILNVSMQWGFEMNLDVQNAVWKKDPVLGGEGAFSDNGIHIMDLAVYLFGLPRCVTGKIDKIRTQRTYDNETAYLFYDSFSVQLQASQSMKHPGNHLLIYGTNGSIEALNALTEASIRRVSVTTDESCEIVTYPPTNLYGKEIEDFCLNLLDPATGHRGTTLQNAVDALRIIETMREYAKSNLKINTR